MASVSRVEYAPLGRSVVGRFTPEERASVRLLPVDVDISCAGHRVSRVPDSAACCTDASPGFSRVAALSAAPLRPLPNRCLIGCSSWPLRLWMIKVIRHVTVFTVSLLGAVGSVPRDSSGDPPRMGRVRALGISAVMNSAARFQ